MRLVGFQIINLRGLQDITLSDADEINVIVGPNAIGKSTMLDAIRLAKVLLSPRVENEVQQVLINLGIINPAYQAIGGRGLSLDSVANDPKSNITISLKLTLDEREISILKESIDSLALLLLRAQVGTLGLENSLAFTQFLSTPVGQQQVNQLKKEAQERVSKLTTNVSLDFVVTMQVGQSSISGADLFSQNYVTLLDRRLPANRTLFSHFPADRMLPQGEQQIQLGSGDVQQQLLSHLATPAIKFNRVKQIIIQTLIKDEKGREEIANEINLIFDQLLPGKIFEGVRINHIGLFTILIKDKATGRIFDIDSMSSGEKGLLLTFLFVRLTLERGSIALLDEPELHLNSAVQERILGFVDKYCVKERGIQVFLFTHSPEIVRDAFGYPGSRLFHLRSGRDLTPILQDDYKELFEVVARLGNTTTDILFNRGNIYVEGADDSEIIKAGFPDVTNGYKFSGLGGRGDVEREAPALKKQEQAGKLEKQQLVIIDGDGRSFKFENGRFVKVVQWTKYCLENYLIDETILHDLVSQYARDNPGSRGEFANAVRDLAIAQAEERAIREVYASENFSSPGLRNEDVKGKSLIEATQALSDRIEAAQANLGRFDKDSWASAFIANVEAKRRSIEAALVLNWKDACDGKRLFDDLYVKYTINRDKRVFKKDTVRRMRSVQTNDWRVMRDILSTALTIE